MGSGDWFKTIISRKKGKGDRSKQQTGVPVSDSSNGSKSNSHSVTDAPVTANGASSRTVLSEDTAAVRIQKAYRAHRARKSVYRLKGIVRLHKLAKGDSFNKQSTSTLTHLHAWGRIQAQVKERRLCMVVEGRLKQKKLENQLKLEAKLHDVEVEWCDGSEPLEEILARIHHREEASVKRERTLAYAFTHQWRPNSSQNQGVSTSELGKSNWGWSWKERWIAARPWEIRVPSNSVSPKNGKSNLTNKADKKTNLTTPKSAPAKSKVLNGKGGGKARRLSFPGTEPSAGEEKPKSQSATTGLQKIKKGNNSDENNKNDTI